MFFTREALTANASRGGHHMRDHWSQLWASRDYQAHSDEVLRHNALSAGLQVNASGITREFWQEMDNQILELRDQETGMEIVNDLLTVQTVLDIGKTLKLYNQVGGIDDSVSITMDGQAPYSFDHADYESDGDPIPIIQAGYGVNWRHFLGLKTVGIDNALDSQNAKVREYNKKLVGLTLDGRADIRVNGYQSQGLRNHRHTKKFDLGTNGLNINLATATPKELMEFFQKPFAQELDRNRIQKLTVFWVSPEIWSNLSLVHIENGVTTGTVLQYLLKFIRVGEIRMTFALKDNEFLGYVRQRDMVTPLVGMPTSVLPLPRLMPESNYNFRIMGAMGIQVKVDSQGLGGVFYGANLT